LTQKETPIVQQTYNKSLVPFLRSVLSGYLHDLSDISLNNVMTNSTTPDKPMRTTP